ncbi:acyloxyacyl hydrolase [Pseudomonas sp.]|uniref:acyloxyacyl hydrolase n=1 Tax=Pseudomonas sp. TaxID=306 RepID=UPI0023546D8F|nr:acyloxyacyl hydrolase [Pseudomonas sp.]
MANFTHAAQWSASLGATGQGDMTYRIGLSQDWAKTWMASETGRLTGYWDAGYTYWEGAEYSGAHSLSFSPVFVYEFAGEGVQPYIELGVGVSFFSKTDVGERQLGSSFNFEDRLGVGLKLSATQKVGVRAIHYSNAGLKSPNAGIESFALFYNQAF